MGGKSIESGSKGCPINAAKTLWYLGRLRCSDRLFLDWDYIRIKDKLSKNGLYVIITIDILENEASLSVDQVWSKVKAKFNELFPNDTCSTSNQGGSTLAFKLWHLGVIKTSHK